MKFPLIITFLLVDQTPTSPHFRLLDQGQIEVIAPLSPVQQKTIPAGKLTPEQGENWLRLCLINPHTNKPGPAMLGLYQHDNAELIFRPRFGLEPGSSYRAFFGPIHSPIASQDYRHALRNGGVPATVVKVFPTAPVLPANVLKFYVYFSQPMRGGQEIFNQIEILDAEGKVVSDAWLMDELWDESGQILIIYIHPGRIKWGVVLREVLGPVLLPDRDYTFVVRGTMVDANGQKLGKDITKKFHTTAEDRVRINLKDWEIQTPKVGTKAPLTVRFTKSMDHKSLERLVAMVDVMGNAVSGSISVGQNEKALSFTPANPWENQEYRLLINGRLEDVAGNTPLRPFDMDLQAPAQPAQRLDLPFRPHP